MHIIVATSQGKKLKQLHNPPYTWLRYIPGGMMKDLTKAAVKMLKEARTQYTGWSCGPDFVYFAGGLPDLTVKDKWEVFDGTRLYEEVYFQEDPHGTPDRMKATINKAATDILAHSATPVFSTIVPMQIEKWNHTRLSQQKTTHLLQFHHYKDMQISLLQATIYTNRYIHELNNYHGVVTPSLAKTILYSRRGKYRFRHSGLEDGVHPDDELASDWRGRLTKAMDTNDELAMPQLPAARDSVLLSWESEEDVEFGLERVEFE